MWHVDSYNKLKPYGICVNGTVDDDFMRILQTVTQMSEVERRKGTPARIRTDMGTENGTMKQM